MKLLKWLFNFYLDASIHVALAVISLMKVFTYSLNITVDDHLVNAVFFGTITCYNFVKYGVEAKKYLVVIVHYHRKIQILSFIAGAVAAYHVYFLPPAIWMTIGVLMLLTGVYALPILAKPKNLRSLSGVKMIIVAAVWTGTVLILPSISSKMEVGIWDLTINCLQCFLIVFVLLIPFEIRDLANDAVELQTMPQRYGVKRTKQIGILLSILFFGITFFLDSIYNQAILWRGIAFILLTFSVYKAQITQGKYYASFWVEAIPIVLWGIIYFGNVVG